MSCNSTFITRTLGTWGFPTSSLNLKSDTLASQLSLWAYCAWLACFVRVNALKPDKHKREAIA